MLVHSVHNRQVQSLLVGLADLHTVAHMELDWQLVEPQVVAVEEEHMVLDAVAVAVGMLEALGDFDSMYCSAVETLVAVLATKRSLLAVHKVMVHRETHAGHSRMIHDGPVCTGDEVAGMVLVEAPTRGTAAEVDAA